MSTKPKDKIFGPNLTEKARNICEYSNTVDSMTDIADRIADWALGGSDPELDTFARTLRSGG